MLSWAKEDQGTTEIFQLTMSGRPSGRLPPAAGSSQRAAEQDQAASRCVVLALRLVPRGRARTGGAGCRTWCSMRDR